jgi:lipopolysaccharide export system ATP-binding protein
VGRGVCAPPPLWPPPPPRPSAGPRRGAGPRRPPPPACAPDSIGKSFGAKTVLKAASVWAWAGKITVLFGRNGCGKSTLLRIGAGVLTADQGVVHYAGRAFLRPRLSVLAGLGLFYLPERNLYSTRLPIHKQLDELEWRYGDGRRAEVLDRLGITSVVERRVGEISGGERRRAEIAAALIRQPSCLLADEPFQGINPNDAELLARTLRDLARAGCAIVITGHEVPQLMEIADEIVWMVAGTTHALGAPDVAGRHEQFRREYLGPAGLP